MTWKVVIQVGFVRDDEDELLIVAAKVIEMEDDEYIRQLHVYRSFAKGESAFPVIHKDIGATFDFIQE